MSKKEPNVELGKTHSAHKRKRHVRTVRFEFVLVVFLIFAVTNLAAIGIFIFLSGLNFMNGPIFTENPFLASVFIVVSMAVASVLLGTAVSFIISKKVLTHISRINEGMRQISNGNFKARVEESDTEDYPTEFGELERTFNKMAADLDGMEMFRNDFINNFSHEFKTPIVSIRGFARQLQNESLSAEQRREYIEIIVAESDSLASMSKNVLLLSKLENQQIVTGMTEFDLDEQIRNSLLLLEKEWTAKNIELDLDDLGEAKVYFNEEMLSHIWINLISNSIKFSNEGGKLYISLDEADGQVRVVIRDYGIGMSHEVQERMFEKFYQGDTSHAGMGNGIGLNIVRRVLTLAKGSIRVRSKIGWGSEFTVVLPASNRQISK